MAIIQRFGGALNVNVHIHALVIDGVFAKDGAGLRSRRQAAEYRLARLDRKMACYAQQTALSDPQLHPLVNLVLEPLSLRVPV